MGRRWGWAEVYFGWVDVDGHFLCVVGGRWTFSMGEWGGWTFFMGEWG